MLIAAEAQVGLYDALLAHVPLSEAAKRKLLDLDRAFIPILK